MVLGIGIDTVSISEMDGLMSRMHSGCLRRMFSGKELEMAFECTEPASYLATRFAAKEATFKAVADRLPDHYFDLRLVETLNRESGAPYICIHNGLGPVLRQAGITQLLVSITTEGDYATAFVVAQ